jgi:D-erythronate 2-dehydrogenase
MKRALVTGAGGFVGLHLVELLLAETDWHITLLDTHLPESWLEPNSRVTKVLGDISQSTFVQNALIEPCDTLFHLAALPGGAAEQNPLLSRAINLEATLDLFDLLAKTGNCPKIVYSSTIAVLGAPTHPVNDTTSIEPAMTYGTHKAMVELALADLHRRKTVDAICIRLPGIVARPLATNGLKSAFLSNAFQLLAQGKAFVSPVSKGATMWLMSVQQCAQNLLWAAQLDSQIMPLSRVVTSPALRVSMQDLLNEIVVQTQTSHELISWQPEPQLELLFGQQPALQTPAAEKAGFKHDGQLSCLVKRALLNCQYNP